jgi:hypothetical protein
MGCLSPQPPHDEADRGQYHHDLCRPQSGDGEISAPPCLAKGTSCEEPRYERKHEGEAEGLWKWKVSETAHCQLKNCESTNYHG